MAAKTLVYTVGVARSPPPPPPPAAAALRSPNPTSAFSDETARRFDSKLLETLALSPIPTEDTTSWGSRLSSRSQLSDGDDSNKISPPLSVEIEILKQHLRRKWPRPLFRFSLRAMRRVVVSPVPIPSELTDPQARIATVSGVHIPLTRQMHMRQKGAYMRRRLPDTLDEYVAY